MVGIAERGPINKPVLVTSWEQFVKAFGGYIQHGYLAYAARAFFDNGGSVLHVCRVANYTDPTRRATLTAVPMHLEPSEAVEFRRGEGAYTHAAFNSSYAALYYPWIEISDNRRVRGAELRAHADRRRLQGDLLHHVRSGNDAQREHAAADFGLGIWDCGFSPHPCLPYPCSETLIRISKCRLSLTFPGAGGADRGDDHRDDLVGFAEERFDGFSGRFACVAQHLKPVHRLVAFFLDDGELGDEVGRGLRPARRPVVGSNRGRATHELLAKHPRDHARRERLDQANHADSKVLGSLLEVLCVHRLSSPNLSFSVHRPGDKSAIPNPESEIGRSAPATPSTRCSPTASCGWAS
jgi:hypothetical protein